MRRIAQCLYFRIKQENFCQHSHTHLKLASFEKQMWQRTFSLIFLYFLHFLSVSRFLFLCRISTTRNYFMGKFVLINYYYHFNWAMKKAARAFSHEPNQQSNEMEKKKLFLCMPQRAFDVAADELLQASCLWMTLFCVVFNGLSKFWLSFGCESNSRRPYVNKHYVAIEGSIYTLLNDEGKSILIFELCIRIHTCPQAHLAKQ